MEHFNVSYRLSHLLVPVFVFKTDTYLPATVISTLKKNRCFVDFIRDEIVKAIEQMSEEEIAQIIQSIDEAINKKYMKHTGKDVFKLSYRSNTKRDKTHEGIFSGTLLGFAKTPESREEIIIAAKRLTMRDISK